MTDRLRGELFDHLEDILVKGWHVPDGGIPIDDLEPLVDTARALLMIERGKEPILPRGFTALGGQNEPQRD